MKSYRVFQQRHPLAYKSKDEEGHDVVTWYTNLEPVAMLEARSGSEAIDLAKQLPVFRSASRRTLGAFPIVQQQEE